MIPVSLLQRATDLKEVQPFRQEDLFNQQTESVLTKSTYGRELSLTRSTWQAGCHTRPHADAGDHLIYVVTGELSIFMEDHEYKLETGDFLNVPDMAVHWSRNRTAHACVTIDAHSPRRIQTHASSLLDSLELQDFVPSVSNTIWLSDEYADDEADLPLASEDSVWFARGESVGTNVHRISGIGSLTSKFVYSQSLNFMIARRAAGYHSKPHVHDCEQMNLLVEGRLWIFVKDRAYQLSAGDFFRVPRGAVHWAYNDSEDCVLVEAHAPVLDPASKEHAVALLPEEQTAAVKSVRNLFVRLDDSLNEEAMMAGAP
jgi:quercetin dioxygenase-like cupin family protein